MNDFFKPYPKEVYSIANLLPSNYFFSAFNFRNRCFNIMSIHPKKKGLNIIDSIIGDRENKKVGMHTFFQNNWSDFEEFVNKYFPQNQNIKELIEVLKGTGGVHSDYKERLHYELLEIFSSYPMTPKKYMDGILKTMEKRCAVSCRFNPDLRYKFAECDLLVTKDFEEGPPAKLALYDEENDPILIRAEDDKCGKHIFAPQDQETPKFYSEDQSDYSSSKTPINFFTNYLWYFWSFDTEDRSKYSRYLSNAEKKDIIKKGATSLIVVPIYSAGFPGGDYGIIAGHLYCPFKTWEERDKNVNELWNTWAPLVAQTLLKSREEALLAKPLKHGDDILKDLLSKVTFVQDWEKAAVFKRKSNGEYELRYCFKRYFGNPNKHGHQDYEEIWGICYPGKKCETEGCYMRLLEAKNQIDGKMIDGKCFYWWPIKHILDPLVLPSVVQEEIARYENHVICFEFPEYTFFPPKDDKEEAITEVGEHYVNKLIPIFDKLLLKKRVLQHSIKAAVSAIISRNHSHHIGSHVTPRSTVEKIENRLQELGYKNRASGAIAEIEGSANALQTIMSEDSVVDHKTLLGSVEDLLLGLPPNVKKISDRFKEYNEVLNLLKTRLDTYIQKKADFSAEIGTEPLITTKSISFFKEIFIPFLENTLLLDGIGANEGIRYESMTKNRIKLHLLFNGVEVGADWTCLSNESHKYSYNAYPYSGYCDCCRSEGNEPNELKQIPWSYDIKIAVPGPLGEFAVYSILENFIRNAIKHNRSELGRTNGTSEGLKVFLDIVNLDTDDPDRDDFYKIQIWDNLTNPCGCRKRTEDGGEETISLKNMLNDLIERRIVEDDGSLKKGAWGIAEMKIMATLLRGSDDFLNMANFQAKRRRENGENLLVYEFMVMKPKEIAVISDTKISEEVRTKLQGYGIWYFNDFDAFSQHFEERKSIASFRFVIIHIDLIGDENLTKRILARLPSRVLRIGNSENPSGCSMFKEKCTLDNAIREATDPEKIIDETWKHWISFLMERHSLLNSQLMIYLQQNRDNPPTSQWKNLEEECNESSIPLSLDVVHEDDWNPHSANTALPILLYDRHAGAIERMKNQRIKFYEAVDKCSSDFTNIFVDPASCITVYEFAEAAMLNVLVMDERIAERAHDEMDVFGGLSDYLSGKGKEPNRISLAKMAKISLCTHLCVNMKEKPLHEHVVEEESSIKISLDLDRTTNAKELQLTSFKSFYDGQQEEGIAYDIAIIHQGVLEGFIMDKIQPFSYDEFVAQLKTKIPYVVITSGRGIPHDIPDSAKFLPFSLLEDYVMKGGIAKYRLTRIVMDLIRRDV